jgi:hypothetical protein
VMNSLRLNDFGPTNAERPGGNRADAVSQPGWRLGLCNEQLDKLISHSPDASVNGAVPMSQNHPDARAAAALRARLVAIASGASSAGARCPRHELARSVGPAAADPSPHPPRGRRAPSPRAPGSGGSTCRRRGHERSTGALTPGRVRPPRPRMDVTCSGIGYCLGPPTLGDRPRISGGAAALVGGVAAGASRQPAE